MRFQDLVSISGLPGLYQLITTKSDGAIVKSIDDNVTKFVAARSHSVTALDGIEVFTNEDNMRLFDVFLTMKSNKESAGEFDLIKGDNNTIKAHFEKLFPSYDKDRVYVSDMKKMIKWLAILDAKNLLVAPVAETAAEVAAELIADVAETPKPKKEKKQSLENETEKKPKAVSKKKAVEKPAE